MIKYLQVSASTCFLSLFTVFSRCLGRFWGRVRMDDLLEQKKSDKWLECGALLLLSVVILYVSRAICTSNLCHYPSRLSLSLSLSHPSRLSLSPSRLSASCVMIYFLSVNRRASFNKILKLFILTMIFLMYFSYNICISL